MHRSGLVAAWLVVIGIGVGVYFSAKAFSVRDKWMELAQKNETEIKKNDDEIVKQKRILNEKRAELARTMLGWDRYWSDVPAVLNAQGILGLQLGAQKTVQPDQVLYVFAPNPDGSSVYLGDFKVTKLGDNTLEAKPNSRVRPRDWKPLETKSARVRTLIPQSHQTRLGALDQQLLAALLTKETNQQELARQGVLLAQSEKLIEARLAEINGNPALANLAIPDVHITGLLTSIVEEEESRNAALLEADRLMRQLKRARDKFAEIRHDNERRVEGLPQPGPRPSPTVGSTGRTVGSNGR